MTGLWGDFRIGLRMLMRTPGVTVAALVLLALGLGANLSIFSLLNAVLLRPQPGVHSPQTLTMIGWSQRGRGFSSSVSYPNYTDLRERSRTLSGVAALDIEPYGLSADGRTERVQVAEVTSNFFDVLGVGMTLGSGFSPAEEAAPNADVVVISHRFWQRRWGGDPGVIGRRVQLNGRPVTVVGIAASGFEGPYLFPLLDAYVPAGTVEHRVGATVLSMRAGRWLRLLGRLAPGATIAQARGEAAAISANLEERYPEENRDQSFALEPYHPFGDPSTVTESWILLGVILAATLLVLAVVCANVANLLIARAVLRRRESAIRLAIGSSRWRLVRLMLVEGLLLSAGGLGLGLIAASWSMNALAAMLPTLDGIPVEPNVAVDWRVVAFGVCAACIASLGMALPAACQAGRTALVPALKSAEAAVVSRRSWLRGGLTVAQVALSVLLVSAGTLLVRTLQNLRAIDPQIAVDKVLLASFDAGTLGYDEAEGRRLMASVLARVGALPGVEATAQAGLAPLSLGGMSMGPVRGGVEKEGLLMEVNYLSSGYFETLQIPLLRGRDFSLSDAEGSQRVAIVNQNLAEQFWPERPAVGQTLEIGDQRIRWRVVGVVANSLYRSPTEASQPFYYVPVNQRYRSEATLLIRTTVPPLSLAEAVRRAAGDVEPNLPLYNFETMSTHIETSFWPQKMLGILVGSFALLTLLLAAIGLYASLSFHVAQRTREIGLRMALGAPASAVRRNVLRSGFALVAIGLAAGITLAAGAAQAMTALLYGVQASDPSTYLFVAVLLSAVALAACWLPARRATRIDPMAALRNE
jgi:predicted permease